MFTTVQSGTDWFPEEKIIDTRISGPVSVQDVILWEASLHHSLALIGDNTEFRIMIDMVGFEARDTEAHKRFRTVMPVTLSHYGWKIGYLELFEEEARDMRCIQTRGIQCIAAAHAHHDETKMGLYERSYSHDHEHYFTNADAARTWLRNLKYSQHQ
jgi:hypothetical protein